MKALIAVSIVISTLLGCAASSSKKSAARHAGDVLSGADVLKRDNYKILEGQRVALVTNQTGRDRDGTPLPQLLFEAKNVKLVKFLAPEHGLYGTQDEKITDTTDPKTGLPVISIYGKTRKPSKEMLADVDVIVYDLQDVGARFYTVSATLGLCLEAAKENGKKIVVLDRPNPIGHYVDGPIADKDKLNFVAYGPIPVAHGMTMGELAQLFNKEYGINADLTVVPCEGWKHGMWWDETGLVWGNSSPNMRNTTQALLYTGICLLEQTNTSVGRGTNQPFEYFGAPWIDGRKLAKALNDQKIPGVAFVPVEFTPDASKFKGQQCQGCYVVVTDREKIEPVKMGVTIVWQLKQLFGDKFQIDGVNRLFKSDRTMEVIKTAADPKKIPPTWEAELAAWKKTRAKHLIYR
ncbi:MAG: hypothetical protein QOF78_556 [Phycisphaerales bacterium]|jgi:uncharacterized protein YbbC (DUF1343 family)|nr:hypothetical protein [Phycisphaerales bacterium]